MLSEQIVQYLQQQGVEINDMGELLFPTLSGCVAEDVPAHTLLTDYALLHITGEDAPAFLQGQFSSDVMALGGDTVQWSSYSNAKGRMQASFLLWRQQDDFYLMLRKDIAETFRRRLSMFVMRSKVKIVSLEQAACFASYNPLGGDDKGVFSPVLQSISPDELHVVIGGKISLNWLLSADKADLPVLAGQFVAPSRFEFFFIMAAVPWVSLATYESFVPQMTNLDLIGGISFKKGCYPGQEIVARTQYLGKVKRRMFIADVSSINCHAGDEVKTEATGEQVIGKIVAATVLDEKTSRVLVVIQMSAWQAEPFLSENTSARLTLQPLPYLIPDMVEN